MAEKYLVKSNFARYLGVVSAFAEAFRSRVDFADNIWLQF